MRLRPNTPLHITTVALIVGFFCTNSEAFAQKKKPGEQVVITDPMKVDADYAVQGEYYGTVNEPGSYAKPVGLQVIARGDGAFEGVYYEGGLPGEGWESDDPVVRMSSKLYEGKVVFATEDKEISVDGSLALVVGESGQSLGTLRKFARQSPTLNMSAPWGATVLFDGTNTDAWDDGTISADGYLTEGATTKEPVQDFRMHLEFRLPYKPFATGQARGNSGVYIQRRYEVQVLDSFGLEGAANECGGLYRTKVPDVNMCLPPLVWQTYDIWFRAARFDEEGNKTESARLTVKHNGIKIHDDYEIPNKTGAGKKEGPEPMVILLQNHSNPVRFRNIWIMPLDKAAPPDSQVRHSIAEASPGSVESFQSTYSSSLHVTPNFGHWHSGQPCQSGHCGTGSFSGGNIYIGPEPMPVGVSRFGHIWPDFDYYSIP